MPKVTFTGDPNPRARNPGSLTHLDVTFPLNVPVDVSDEIAAKLASHSHFTGPENHARNSGGSVADAGKANETKPEASPKAMPEIRAVHRGRGSYSIMRGDDEIVQGLTKSDAEAFNEMSVPDKVDFIEASK